MDMLPSLTSIATALDRTIDILAMAMDLVATLKNLVAIATKIYNLFCTQWQRQWRRRRYLGGRGDPWWHVVVLDGQMGVAMVNGKFKNRISSPFERHPSLIHVAYSTSGNGTEVCK